MERCRWVCAAIAAMAILGSACSGSGSSPSNSSALPIASLTSTAAARGSATALPGVGLGLGLATPARPGAPLAPATPARASGVPLVPSTPFPQTQQLGPAGIVLLQQQGTGTSQQPTVEYRTATFVAPGSWDMQWRYDCSGLGRAGNLSIDVFHGDGSYVDSPPSLAQLGSGGQGVTPYAVGGPLYLVVNSVCAWSVVATTAARPTATPIGSSSVPASAAAAAGPAPAAAATAAAPTVATPFGATATPGAGAAGAGTGPAVATATAAPTVTATATSAANSNSLASLTAGRPILAPSINTPIPPIQAAQGVFAVPSGVSFATPAAAFTAAPPIVQATPLPISVTVMPIGTVAR